MGMIPPLAQHPLAPGVDVFEHPGLVAIFVGQHVGVERERRRAQVQRGVADDVVVVLEVLEHLLVAVLAVAGPEPVLDLDRVAGPVERRRLAEQRAAAAVEQAADDLVLGVVVRRARDRRSGRSRRIASPAAGIATSCGIAQALEVEDRQPLAVVQPVEHDGEFLVIHPVAGERHVGGLGRGVLAEMAFPGFLEHASGSSRRRRVRTAPASR